METAKGTDLPDLLEHLGYTVRRLGSRYHTTREMDSIRIKDRRTWKRYSNGKGGDAITFLQEFCGKDFREAVNYLLEFNGKRARDSPAPRPKPAQAEEKPVFSLPIPHPDQRRVFAYTDVERGERGSSEEHLTVAQFKTEREHKRLAVLERQVEKKGQALQKIEQETKMRNVICQSYSEIDNMGRRTFTGKLELTQQESERLKRLAKNGIVADSEIADLKHQLQSARRDAQIWKRRYEQLVEQTREFLAALKKAPERVKEFISRVLHVKQIEEPKVRQQRDSVSR